MTFLWLFRVSQWSYLKSKFELVYSEFGGVNKWRKSPCTLVVHRDSTWAPKAEPDGSFTCLSFWCSTPPSVDTGTKKIRKTNTTVTPVMLVNALASPSQSFFLFIWVFISACVYRRSSCTPNTLLPSDCIFGVQINYSCQREVHCAVQTLRFSFKKRNSTNKGMRWR